MLCVIRRTTAVILVVLLVGHLPGHNYTRKVTAHGAARESIRQQYEAVPIIINGVEHPIRRFVAAGEAQMMRRWNGPAQHRESKARRLELYRNMSEILGVGRVHRCPFEYIQASVPYEPIVIVNKAVEVLFKQGYFQAALTCFRYALGILQSGEIEAQSPQLLAATVQSVKDNIEHMKVLLSPPKQMITKRMFHIPSKDNFPHSSKPVWEKKDRTIMMWDGALSDSHCEHIIGLFGASELYQGNIFNGESFVIDAANKNVWEFDISGTAPNDARWAAVDRLIVSVTIKHLIKYERYNKGLNSKMSPLSDGGFQMKRYEVNNSTEHHSYHIDSGHFPHCGPQRLLAVIIYLNNVSEGGETVFLNQGLVVKPKCGRVLLFPTALQYTHAGRAPISNAKYNIVGFIME
jgi:hypothetical protein